MSKFQSLLITTRDRLRIIKFNNPSKKNAWNRAAYKEITQALNEANEDESVSVVALTGAGDFYSSGNDISAVMSRTTEANIEDTLNENSEILFDMVKSYYTFSKLLIAVVNGPAIGIAATTAALCDVIYAAENAYFYTPFTALGLCSEACSSITFPRILGRSKAAEMLLLNHKLTAKEALQFNFISDIYKQEEVNTKIWARIEEFAKLPMQSIIVTKSLMNKTQIDELEIANRNEILALKERFISEDFINAAIAFMQRKSKL